MTNYNEPNKTNFTSEPQTHDSSKNFFASYAKGDNSPQVPVNNYNPQTVDTSKNFFTSYAKGDNSSQMTSVNRETHNYAPQAPK